MRPTGLKLTVVSVAALPLLLLLGVLLATELRASRLAAPLVTDAGRVAAFRRVRAGSADAGSAGGCLGRAIDAAPELDVSVGVVAREMNAETELPAQAVAAMTQHDPWLRATAACARLPVLEPTDGLGPLADPGHARRAGLVRLQQTAGALAPLRVSSLLDVGAFAEAAELCGDAFALVADLSWLEGHESALPSLALINGLVRPCAAVAWHARDDPALLRAFRARLAQVRATAPPYSHVLELERVAQSVRLFGLFLSKAQQAALPPGAAVMAATSASRARPTHERLALANWWAAADRAFRASVAVADLPEPARTRALVVARRPFESPWLKMLGGAQVDGRYELYAECHDTVLIALELVEAAVTLTLKEALQPQRIDVRRAKRSVSLAATSSHWLHVSVDLEMAE